MTTRKLLSMFPSTVFISSAGSDSERTVVKRQVQGQVPSGIQVSQVGGLYVYAY